MYLKCSVTFQENTCILTFCMSFTRIPKESKIHLENISDTVHQDTCILRASLVSHWIHIRIHQDTCILDSSSRYIRIHVSWTLRPSRAGYTQDTLRTYMRDKCICIGSRIHEGYMRETSKIHARYMYLICILRGTYLRCKIHAGYM